ncbi:hypothetical protein OSB04_032171 [Centaurea solstitialis]|uniref:SWIM-type domain-containing protein n=1 Tax=Centaurea solstitialis TaxID=347529 RepID=A0AA38SW37_9ASTR|nr:hypothetical protein OSB04_032171 [Centaurea solstitialis]
MDIDPTLIEDAPEEEYETTDMMNFSQTVVEGDLLDECNHDTNFDAFDAPIGRVASNEEFPPAMVEEEDVITQFPVETPRGSKVWYPNVDVTLKPKIGDYYESLSVAEATYRKYAEQAGFDVRLSNKKINKLGVITGRYFVCSRTGKPPEKYFDSLDVVPGGRKQRNSNIKRTGCQACMKIHFVKERGRYEIYKFIEKHNHELFIPEEMIFSRARRQLQYADHRVVMHGSSSKIGITKAHWMRNALKGGTEFSSCTARDYLNFKRDMMKHVGNKDAQMLVNKLENRRKVCPEYFVEYKRKDNELISIFWADETAPLNYKMFGDVISFDATYRTNKHAMIFVPFVAIDNHKSSVVVGAALINGENIPNYTWILQAFMKAHGRQPLFVITDQCPAMKQAIPMGDGWFDEMYRIRESWIPAYYKDCHMSGLMKTTSRSESINAFFNVFAEYENDLTGFITAFDNAIDEQWGKHGSLEAVWRCGWGTCVEDGETKIYMITHKNKRKEVKATYKVVQIKKDNTIDCSCNLFVRIGILCRHALKVLLNDESDCIPEKYILQRVQWLPPSIRYGEVDVDKHRLMGKAFNVFERQVARVRQNNEALSNFVDYMEKWDFANAVDVPTQSQSEMKQASFEEHLGVAVPENAETLPPTGIRNKGCGTNSRMKSSKERAISKGKKLKR